MRTLMTVSTVLLLGASAIGCGANADGSPTQPGADEPAPRAESTLADEVKCDGTEVTVKNYLSWCEVTVGSGTKSSAAEQKVCAPAGTLSLTAAPVKGFELGKHPWHDVTTSSGGDATLDTTGTHHCSWVCCPGVGGSAPCPTTNQCAP